MALVVVQINFKLYMPGKEYELATTLLAYAVA
jgi:hypothetical protein